MSDRSEHSVHVRAVRDAIARMPRTSLGVFPTPLQLAPRLTDALGGPRIYVKRDDLSGLALGGNKTRMLEFVLAEALAEGADTVVGGSAVQSNYSRQLAAACAKLGLDCQLVLRRVRGRQDDLITGSLMLDLLFGATVRLVDDDRTIQANTQLALASELRASGRRVFLAPIASNVRRPLHSVAYVDAWLEFREQCVNAGIHATHIYVCSLDTTHAGLRIGRSVTGDTTRIVAITPNERAIFEHSTIEDEVRALERATADLLQIQSYPGETDDLIVRDEFVGGRYGEITADGLSAMKIFAATESLLLDPVYTAKAGAALLADISAERLGPDDTVVFWHTGGAPALFAYADELGLSLARPPILLGGGDERS